MPGKIFNSKKTAFSCRIICITALFVFSFLPICACNVDVLGTFRSNNLNDRLKEKNNLKLLSAEGWASMSLTDEFSFIVLADTHLEGGNAYGLEKLKDAISANNAIPANSEIKFAVFAGDVTQYGSRTDLNKFIEIAKSLGVPCYPVIGNHDIYFNDWSAWKDLIGSTRYRIDAGGATLFILDSANAFFGKDQLNWLDSELKSAHGRVFVFTHSNLFIDSQMGIQQLADVRECAKICSILKNRCDIMFMGHQHKQGLHEAGGVQYLSVESFKDSGTYCLVTVKKSGKPGYRFVKL